jgi:hypothetical protein
VGQEDEGEPSEGEAARGDEDRQARDAREDEAFRARVRHYSRRARLFKR